MLFFGHIGLSIGAVHILDRRICKQGLDYRKVAFLSIVPDLLDKPLGLRFAKHFGYHTRLYGHSLVFSIGVLLLIWWLARKSKGKFTARVFLLWFSQWLHLVIDRTWYKSLNWLLWPFMPPPPPLEPDFFRRWYDALFEPYNYWGETSGLLIIAILVMHYKLYQNPMRTIFFKTGRIYQSSLSESSCR